MRSLNLLSWAGALALALSLNPGRAVAQDAFSITGTFRASNLTPTVGADLAGVYANGNAHWWKLTLSGVSVSHEHTYETYENGGYWEEHVTRVQAASFDFEFFGPDAAVLNAVAGDQLAVGQLVGGAVIEFVNGDYYDPQNWFDSGPYGAWTLGVAPLAPGGVSFRTSGGDFWFAADADGYPLVEPRRFSDAWSIIVDSRPGNGGLLSSYPDIVDIGSDQPPPPPAPLINIADATVQEGDKGATTVFVTVTVNSSAHAVSVNYHTFDGTADKRKDYASASGTLVFQPGETSKRIALSIKGDRAREPDETFTVQLSDAVGANPGRSVATVTIVNDD
jgi:hypothetical protein